MKTLKKNHICLALGLLIVVLGTCSVTTAKVLNGNQMNLVGGCDDCDHETNVGCVGIFCVGDVYRCEGTSTTFKCIAGSMGSCQGFGGECGSTPQNEDCTG